MAALGLPLSSSPELHPLPILFASQTPLSWSQSLCVPGKSAARLRRGLSSQGSQQAHSFQTPVAAVATDREARRQPRPDVEMWERCPLQSGS